MAFLYFQQALVAIWLAMLFYSSTVSASYWTITRFYQYKIMTNTFMTYTDTWASYSWASTLTLNPTASPTNAPIASSTTTTIAGIYHTTDSIEFVDAYLSDGAVASDLTSSRIAKAYQRTLFFRSVTYFAPSSCKNPFTVSTLEFMQPPSQVTNYLRATPISSYYAGITQYVQAVLDPAQATPGTYIWTACATPTRFPNVPDRVENSDSGSDSTSSNKKSSGGFYCNDDGVCNLLRAWTIALIAIIPALFVFGFLESYLWFRRLMLGKGCLRGGTVSWIMLSLLVLCFTRTESRRSSADHKELRIRWNKIRTGKRISLWWKWGFRHRYPVELLGPKDGNGLPAPVGTMSVAGEAGVGFDQPPPPIPQQQQQQQQQQIQEGQHQRVYEINQTTSMGQQGQQDELAPSHAPTQHIISPQNPPTAYPTVPPPAPYSRNFGSP